MSGLKRSRRSGQAADRMIAQVQPYLRGDIRNVVAAGKVQPNRADRRRRGKGAGGVARNG